MNYIQGNSNVSHTYHIYLDSDSARSTVRASRIMRSITAVVGCALPNTRRAVGAVSSSVDTASRRSSSVAPGAAKRVFA